MSNVIAKALGVEVGQKFRIKDYGGDVVTFEILEDGTFETEPPKMPGSAQALLRAVEHPENVIGLKQLTDEELGCVCEIFRNYGGEIRSVERNDEGKLFMRYQSDVAMWMPIDKRLFPSLKNGEEIQLKDYEGL